MLLRRWLDEKILKKQHVCVYLDGSIVVDFSVFLAINCVV